MAFALPQKTLADALGIAAKISTEKTMPVFGCVKIRFGGKGIEIEATDNDNWLKITTADFKEKDSETAIIPCKQLLSIVAGIDKSQDITLSITEKRMTVKTKTSRYTFGLLPIDEWPSFKWEEKIKPVNIFADDLVEGLQFTLPSTKKEEGIQHYLQGVHFSESGDLLRLCASDGHQLSHIRIPIDAALSIGKGGIIVPATIGRLIVELLAETKEKCTVGLTLSETKIRVEFNDQCKISLTGRLIDGQFPEIDRVIPYGVNKPKKMVFNRRETLDAIGRIAPMALYGKGGPLNISFNGNTAKLAAKTDTSDGEETIGIYGDKAEFAVTFGVSKMLSIMNAFDCDKVMLIYDHEATIQNAGVLSDVGAKITPETRRFAVIMPMRG